MKKILIYGDSNTWGSTEYDEHGRLGRGERWAGKLRGLLGDGFEIDEAGYPGRCAGSFEKARERDKDYDGHEHYEIFFKTATPVDLVIIALGTNDLKKKYERTVDEIVEDLVWFEGRTRYMEDYNGKMPKFLYILPPQVENQPGWFEMEEAERVKLCERLREKFEDYIDLERIALTGDGVHYSVEGHEEIAKRVAEKIRLMTEEGKL